MKWINKHFHLEIRDDEVTLVLNHTSYFIKIDQIGLRRCNTGYPQDGIDYDKSNGDTKPIITGVDIV